MPGGVGLAGVMAVLPIRTERLALRVMQTGDAAVLAAYRDDPETARFQDWPLPFTLADAERLLAGQEHFDDLDADGWTLVAIEHEGEVVGDLAVGLETSPRQAALRYTIAPGARHRGFAVEAAGALVVGFVMLALVTDTFPDPYLWRFMIDRWHQRRGIGGRVMSMLIEQLREGATIA